MSGAGFCIPIVPLRGRRTATHWSVNRQIKRLILDDWLEHDASPPVVWLSEKWVGFGAESPDTIAEEAERIEAAGEDPDDYTPSPKIQWASAPAPGTIAIFVHAIGYAPTDLIEHWLHLSLALRIVAIDVLLRRLGYRRGLYRLPSPREAYYRQEPKSAFASPAFCQLNGAHYLLRGDKVQPYMARGGELSEGPPIAIARLARDDRRRVEELRDKNLCGCSYCLRAGQWPFPRRREARGGWTAEFVDAWGYRDDVFVPLANGRQIALTKERSRPRAWLYRSHDGGKSWRRPRVFVNRSLRSAARTERAGVEAVLLAFRRRDKTLQLVASTDAGVRWVASPLPLEGADDAVFFECPFRPSDLVAIVHDRAGRRLALTRDGGLTWSVGAPLRSGKAPLPYVLSVVFSPGDPGRLLVVGSLDRQSPWDSPRVVLATDDSGQSFHRLTPPEGFAPSGAFLGRAPGLIALTGEATPDRADLIRSTDGGQSWKTTAKNKNELTTATHTQRCGRWFWKFDSATHVSEDEGLTWTSIADAVSDLMEAADSDDALYSMGEFSLMRLWRGGGERRG